MIRLRRALRSFSGVGLALGLLTPAQALAHCGVPFAAVAEHAHHASPHHVQSSTLPDSRDAILGTPTGERCTLDAPVFAISRTQHPSGESSLPSASMTPPSLVPAALPTFHPAPAFRPPAEISTALPLRI